MTRNSRPDGTDESEFDAPDSRQTPADGLAIAYRPARQPWRQIRFEERPDADGWWLINEEWTGCSWRTVGREPVDEIFVNAE
ncbi:hypothetical protein DJ84_10060 [Halorubrum ezzemoulense]|nr:hypothetical protein DJ84_10060 [Halorubrum ezzemoulense]